MVVQRARCALGVLREFRPKVTTSIFKSPSSCCCPSVWFNFLCCFYFFLNFSNVFVGWTCPRDTVTQNRSTLCSLLTARFRGSIREIALIDL
jgi:hypothetical protein